jgi:hypothetical protein
MNNDQLTKALVKNLLENPHDNEWSIQGLGMLRTYLAPETRLHVWSQVASVEAASKMHTHPWDFESLIVSGRVCDFNCREITQYEGGGTRMRKQTIRCGEGGGLIGEPEDVRISVWPPKAYTEGQTYSHKAEDIHYSVPEEGSVTIIQREFREDTEHAFVYFNGEWGTAEPRPATDGEIVAVCGSALERWFA